MIKSSLWIIRRELYYMWHDRGMRNILLFAPLLGIIIFGAIYSVGVLQDIPTAVVDLDRSESSRELIMSIAQAENLKITSYPNSYKELEEMIQKGQIIAGVVIPEDYGKNINLRRQTTVFMVIDGSNMVYATNASSSMLEITGIISAKTGIKTLLATRMAEPSPINSLGLPDPGINIQQAKRVFQPIEFKEEAWFNPTLNYGYFLLLGLFLNIWQQCCMMASCMNIIGETGMKSWVQFKACGFSKGQLFVSKSIAHIIVFMVIVIPIYFISFYILKLPLQVSFIFLIIFTVCFTLALHSLGTLMSSVADNSVDSTRFGMVVALPSFVLSGFTWPIEAMPQFLQPLVKILPQTWFFQGINYLSFKNPGWEFWSWYLEVFILIAVVCYGLSIIITSVKER